MELFKSVYKLKKNKYKTSLITNPVKITYRPIALIPLSNNLKILIKEPKLHTGRK